MEAQTKDKYDLEIDRLARLVAEGENGDESQILADSWNNIDPLFAYIADWSKLPAPIRQWDCGCLTMYRSGFKLPATLPPELEAVAKEIKADTRIPSNDRELRLCQLPVFAEWQRRLDREFPQYR